MESVSLFGALLLGLMGAGHCLAMCGGIISSLSISGTAENNRANWSFIILYQFGRISSYTIFGAIAGWLGFQFDEISPLPILKILSGILLILMAFYVSKIWLGLSYLEKAGKHVWKRISPLTKRFLPVTKAWQAMFLGGIWGWLPCGLVYTSLGYALSLGDSFSSALFMLLFGIGTLPATILAGTASLSVKKFLNNHWVRYSSALIFFAMGVFTLYTIFFAGAGSHHHH